VSERECTDDRGSDYDERDYEPNYLPNHLAFGPTYTIISHVDEYDCACGTLLVLHWARQANIAPITTRGEEHIIQIHLAIKRATARESQVET
jgi:hypothetical protein